MVGERRVLKLKQAVVIYSSVDRGFRDHNVLLREQSLIPLAYRACSYSEPGYDLASMEPICYPWCS
jgi:hypothetical protein